VQYTYVLSDEYAMTSSDHKATQATCHETMRKISTENRERTIVRLRPLIGQFMMHSSYYHHNFHSKYSVGTNKKGETVALNVRAPHGKVLACSMPNSSANSQGDTKKNDGFSNGRENRQQSRNENSMEI